MTARNDRRPCIFLPSECVGNGCFPGTASDQTPKKLGGSTNECVWVIRFRNMIQKAIEDDRARAAAEEWAQWSQCFGEDAAAGEKAKRRKIIKIASARAALSILNRPDPA